MKKRFKLITTVASLCLAVALMAFGVYAATQSTLQVSSTVTFEAEDIQVTWNWYVEGGKLPAAVVGSDATEEADNGTEHTADQGANAIPSTIAFDAKDGNTITYYFSCTNNAGAAITVTPTFSGEGKSLFTQATGDGVTANVKVEYYTGSTVASSASDFATGWTKQAWAPATNVAKGATVSFAVKLTLTDCTMGNDMNPSALVGSFVATKYTPGV